MADREQCWLCDEKTVKPITVSLYFQVMEHPGDNTYGVIMLPMCEKCAAMLPEEKQRNMTWRIKAALLHIVAKA